MDIQFVAQLDATADVIIFPVRKAEIGQVGGAQAELLAATAGQSRFEAAAGTLVEASVLEDGKLRRVALLGLGEASEHDLERAGAAITARYQTSGVAKLGVDFTASADVAEQQILSVALGAKLRNWRLDTYRTKLSEQAKPSLKTIVIASAHGLSSPISVSFNFVMSQASRARE